MTAVLEGGEWSAARPGSILPPGKTRQEVGWAPGPVWKDGKSRPHRDSIPVRLARSQSLIPTQLLGPHTQTHTHTHTHIYIYIYTVCTLTCVYVTKRSEIHKNPHKKRESILAMRLPSIRRVPVLNN